MSEKEICPGEDVVEPEGPLQACDRGKGDARGVNSTSMHGCRTDTLNKKVPKFPKPSAARFVTCLVLQTKAWGKGVLPAPEKYAAAILVGQLGDNGKRTSQGVLDIGFRLGTKEMRAMRKLGKENKSRQLMPILHSLPPVEQNFGNQDD